MNGQPLQSRVYRAKRPALTFYCPLCRSERFLSTRSRPRLKHFCQMGILSVCLVAATYPLMKFRALIWVPFVWVFMEAGLKIFFRQQVPCPHCGFDATWYKRDVKVAKRLVQEFWQKKQGERRVLEQDPGAKMKSQT